MVFLNLRQRTDSVQALMTVTPEKVSKQMVKWAASLQDESIVLVEGVVKKSPEIIKSASVGDVELHVFKVCFGHCTPIHSMYNASRRFISSLVSTDVCLSLLKMRTVQKLMLRRMRMSNINAFFLIRASITVSWI